MTGGDLSTKKLTKKLKSELRNCSHDIIGFGITSSVPLNVKSFITERIFFCQMTLHLKATILYFECTSVYYPHCLSLFQ